VPGTDVAIGKKAIRHISFDPRMSPNVMRAFENAEDEVLMNTLKGAARLNVPSLFRPQFMAEVDHGSMYVGSPETVANRIAATMKTLSLSRFDLLYAVGRIPHDQRIATIELYGREVIPRVRELLAAIPEAENAPAAVRS